MFFTCVYSEFFYLMTNVDQCSAMHIGSRKEEQKYESCRKILKCTTEERGREKRREQWRAEGGRWGRWAGGPGHPPDGVHHADFQMRGQVWPCMGRSYINCKL